MVMFFFFFNDARRYPEIVPLRCDATDCCEEKVQSQRIDVYRFRAAIFHMGEIFFLPYIRGNREPVKKRTRKKKLISSRVKKKAKENRVDANRFEWDL